MPSSPVTANSPHACCANTSNGSTSGPGTPPRPTPLPDFLEPRMRTTAAGAESPVHRLDPDTVSTRDLDRHAMAHDASHYLLVPQGVATPRNAADVGALLRRSRELGLPATFRSGGTGPPRAAWRPTLLSDCRQHFPGVGALDGGARGRVRPCAT